MEQSTRRIDFDDMLLLVGVVTGVTKAWLHLQGPDKGQGEGAHVSLAGDFAPWQGRRLVSVLHEQRHPLRKFVVRLAHSRVPLLRPLI